MLAPCAASAFAIQRPMPLVEPVTSAVLPLSMMVSELELRSTESGRRRVCGHSAHARPYAELRILPRRDGQPSNGLLEMGRRNGAAPRRVRARAGAAGPRLR